MSVGSKNSFWGQGLSWKLEAVGANHSKFKGEKQYFIVKLPKSVGARHYCNFSNHSRNIWLLSFWAKFFITVIFIIWVLTEKMAVMKSFGPKIH